MTQPDARTRLREAALELFGRQGIASVSTRAILAEAGMRNPSAITYHFGSKAELIDELVNELVGGTAPVLQLQTELAAEPGPTSIEAWTAIAVDSSITLVSTERGCLLARLWWEYAAYVKPNLFEDFLASGHPLAVGWHDAVGATFPELPQSVAIVRNVMMLRTLEWIIARRAERLLAGDTRLVEDAVTLRQMLFEVSLAIVTAPTKLQQADITFSGPAE